jgi:hypothetical protein
VETLKDPWSRFCAVAGGGGELASASAAAGVATSAVQQLRFVSSCYYLFIYIYMIILFCCTEFGCLMFGDCLRRASCHKGADVVVYFRKETARGKD